MLKKIFIAIGLGILPPAATFAQTAPVAAPAQLATVSGTAMSADEAAFVASGAAEIVGKPSGHYFRLVSGGNMVWSAGTTYDLHGIAPITYLTDLGIITHSSADGSVIPASWQKLGISAEDWVPLQVGAGGSAKIVGGRLTGNAVVAFGTAGNVAPMVLGWAVSNIGPSAPAALQIAKAAIVGDGTDYVKLRIGYVFQGQAISGGTLQSAKEAFPGRGVLDIANKSGRLELSVAKRL